MRQMLAALIGYCIFEPASTVGGTFSRYDCTFSSCATASSYRFNRISTRPSSSRVTESM